MSAETQLRLHGMIEHNAKYGVSDPWSEGYVFALSQALHMIVREDGVNNTGCPTFDKDINDHEAGRTAEPTEAEIEAGAMAIFRTLIISAHSMSDYDYAEAWNCITAMQKDKFRRQSQAVLKAANKAVTE